MDVVAREGEGVSFTNVLVEWKSPKIRVERLQPTFTVNNLARREEAVVKPSRSSDCAKSTGLGKGG